MRVKFYMCGGERDRCVSRIPLGLGYLLSNLPAWVDASIAKRREDLVNCDLIGLSANAWGLQEAVDILQKTDTPVVIGGQGALWDGLADFPFRHIVRGEGETALLRICHGSVRDKVLRVPQIPNIDILKPPLRGAIRNGVLPVMTSRGCPFHCRFCTARAHWQGVRWHSAEYVMAEITSGLAEFPDMKRVYFLDDLFIAHKERFEKLHDLWVADPQIRDLPATGFVRAGVFDDDAARMMIDMGFRTVRFGAESGSDRVLELLGKGTTVEDNWRVVEICRRHGLVCTASFMHGIPGETPADAQATRDFIWQSGIRVEGWYKFAQWPGTDMYDGSSPLECDMRVRPSS